MNASRGEINDNIGRQSPGLECMELSMQMRRGVRLLT